MFWKKIVSRGENENIKLRKKFGNLEISDFYVYLSNIIKVFIEDYGFKKSVEQNLPIDKDENALPLYSYPAIEYLNSLDFNDKEIFEYGSGNSTIFWLNKSAKVTSVENNKKWFEDIKKQTNDNKNHQYILAESEEEYTNSISKDNKEYDLIIIDGSYNRLKCTQIAIKHIKEDGMIIIDNSDWFENSTKFVRDNLDFIQTDFYGFRPSKSNTSVTSIFFSRKVKLNSISNKQPSYAIGGINRHSQNDFSN